MGSGINSIVASGAIFVGGYWAYLKFIRTREGAPKIEFWVELNFIRLHGDYWIAEAVAQVENKGLVRHTMTTFKYDVRFARSSDELCEKGPYSLYFPERAAHGTWMNSETFVDPGVRTRYTAMVRIPYDASVVLLHGKFYYSDNDPHTADKLVATPTSNRPASTVPEGPA